MSFIPLISFGANGANPHPSYTQLPLSHNQFITMDFGAKLGGYCSDITRTVCLGKATDEMTNIYETIFAANRAGFKAAQIGVACEYID